MSTRSRPDVSYDISALASALTKHSEFAFRLAKKILRYLAKYLDVGLNFTTQSSTSNETGDPLRELVIYTDAGFAGHELKSQTGVVILWRNAIVLWRSGRQSTTATSTSEAELTAGSLGTQIGLGLSALLSDWGQETRLRLRWDNRSTLSIAHLGGTWRSRHYAIRAQAVRELLDLQLVTLEYVPTGEQWADILTKALPTQLVRAFHTQFFTTV